MPAWIINLRDGIEVKHARRYASLLCLAFIVCTICGSGFMLASIIHFMGAPAGRTAPIVLMLVALAGNMLVVGQLVRLYRHARDKRWRAYANEYMVYGVTSAIFTVVGLAGFALVLLSGKL